MICGSICRSAIYNGFLPFFYFHACNKLLSFSVKSCSTKCILILNIRVGWLQSITMALLILYWSKISKLLNFYQKPITMCMIVIGIYGSIEILIDILSENYNAIDSLQTMFKSKLLSKFHFIVHKAFCMILYAYKLH